MRIELMILSYRTSIDELLSQTPEAFQDNSFDTSNR